MASTRPGNEPCCSEEWCAVTCTAEILSRKWHTMIIHRLLVHGDLGFAQLERRLPPVSSKVLTEHLGDLREHGIVDRRVVETSPTRVTYRLTERGRDLRPVVEAMEAWGLAHLARGPPHPSLCGGRGPDHA